MDIRHSKRFERGAERDGRRLCNAIRSSDGWGFAGSFARGVGRTVVGRTRRWRVARPVFGRTGFGRPVFGRTVCWILGRTFGWRVGRAVRR